MTRKISASITLALFVAFSAACSFQSVKKVHAQTQKSRAWKGKTVDILAITTLSGEEYIFPQKAPGRVIDNIVVGRIEPAQEAEIPEGEIQSIQRSKKAVTSITTKDGMIHTGIVMKDGRYFGRRQQEVSVPVAEVDVVTFRRTDPVKIFLATAVLGGVVLLAVLSPSTPEPSSSTESCPFVYSFDGRTFVFDAEPYGGATSEGMKRAEWCGLEHLKEVGGEYRLLLTNEVDETQYTDDLKLLVVDHPGDAQVLTDETGRVRTLLAPRPPVRAVDGKGRSVLPQVLAVDQRYWMTPTREKDPENAADLRDELVFEFPRPAGAARAKLVFNGCTTLWGSMMLKKYLELYGADVPRTYEAVKDPNGPMSRMMMSWNEREELYRLQIRVETGKGWNSKGMIVGGGPLVSESRVYALDLADVPGDTLRIKLTPPAPFWMIDALAVDYTEDIPFRIAELEPARAVDNAGRDVRGLLAAEDGRYLVMPDIGDRAEITFQAPPADGAATRSFIVKASGYYDIHLKAEGPCQVDLLRGFLLKPGSAVQYAFKQYLAFRQETARKLQGQ